jgi:o-succinylbenzoate synthase
MSVTIIKQINLQFCKLQLHKPLVTASGTIKDRTGIIIQVIDQLGNFGLGESSPLSGFEMEPIIHTAKSLKRLQILLIGSVISSLEDIDNLLEPCDLPPAAKHGIELALLNLLSSHDQISLAQLLHTHYRQKIDVNALIGQVSPEIAAQKTLQLCQAGYKCLKVKVGDDIDLHRVQAIREAANAATNHHICIRIDANQAWTATEAVQKLRTFAEFDIEFVEQPVKADDLYGMAEVSKSGGIAIAADESVKNLEGLEQIIKVKAASIVILKPMALGGILTAQKAAKRAIQAGLEVVFTTTLDGAIARLGALHLAAMPEISRACGLGSSGLFTTNDLLSGKISVINGEIRI